MGQPRIRLVEYIDQCERTQRIETSQQLQEEKENSIPLVGIRSPFRLCTTTASALLGPTSTSLDVILPLSTLYSSGPRKLPTKYYPYPSLQNITSNFSPRNCCASKIRSSYLHSMYFPNAHQASSYNLLVENQQPRLDSNQWLRSFWLDPRLLLEVSHPV